jgi:hypothetical protein
MNLLGVAVGSFGPDAEEPDQGFSVGTLIDGDAQRVELMVLIECVLTTPLRIIHS